MKNDLDYRVYVDKCIAATQTITFAAMIAANVPGPVTIKWRGRVVFNSKLTPATDIPRIVNVAALREREIMDQLRAEHERMRRD